MGKPMTSDAQLENETGVFFQSKIEKPKKTNQGGIL